MLARPGGARLAELHASRFGWLMRGAVFLAACGALLGTGKPARSAEPFRRIERVLTTDDDWSIYITYYPAAGEKDSVTKESPVVVLLHGDKENRLVWEADKGLVPKLHEAGYAVIAVDLRKHGQSTNVAGRAGDSPAGGKSSDGTNLMGTDYRNMVEFDMAAVKKFIYDENQAKKLNMNKMAIIGAESAADVAMCFAVADWNKEPYDDAPSDELKTPRGQDVRALVLISPPQRVKGLSMNEVISDVRNPDWNIAIATLYGKRNRSDAKDAKAIHHKLFGSGKSNSDRIYLIGYDYNLRGTNLLGKKEVDAESAIVKFLALHLKTLQGDWRDRQSRLTKK
jgi:pimeloyl-ACP methyl ester carboxylesterase